MANISAIKLPNNTTYNITDKTSGYTTNTGTITKVQTTAGTHTAINVSSGNATFNVPTNTSHLTNDSGFITSASIPTLLSGSTTTITPTQVANALSNNQNIEITHTDVNYGTYKFYDFIHYTTPNVILASAIAILNEEWVVLELSGWLANNTWHVYGTTLAQAEDIPIIPENVSDFINDVGYITTETDPTVPSWAKASTKPSYTASEVGALPSSTTYVSKVTTTAGAHSAISNQSGSVSFNVPTKTSHLTNDSGFITISSVPSNWVNGSATGSIRGIGAAEEDSNYTMGIYAVAEGVNTTANGGYSHAEGRYSTASNTASHAEGYDTTASGGFSHAEGINTTAGGNYSHSQNNNTKASSESQTALGKYNIEDTQDTYAVIIGNGTADNARSNALTVDWDGNVKIALDTTASSGTDHDLYTAINNLGWASDVIE